MILLGNKDLKNPVALMKRKNYVLSILDEGFQTVSPSSQEWTSAEFQVGHNVQLRNEVEEIDALLKKMNRPKRKLK